MATIHAFPRSIAAPSRQPTGAMAEIIIFPGVRYERHADAQAATAPKPKRKRKPRAAKSTPQAITG